MTDRRSFCLTAAGAALAANASALAAIAAAGTSIKTLISAQEVAHIDRDRILRAANDYLTQAPITITALSSPRSQGGKHDYFSEGDYWWPDPKIPAGPYIRRDGYSNPANFNDHLLPDQLAANGSFPLELARTKPYSDSLFDLDVLAIICRIVSAEGNSADNLWQYSLPSGNGYKQAVEFMFPFIQDKSKWPYAHDVEYFDDLPNRQPSLLFAGIAYREAKYIALWRKLPPDPKTAEIIRNFPVRQPLLWVTQV